MYGMDMLVGAGLGGLLIGGILAFFWGRSSSDGSQQARELERKLDQVTREKKAYEERVTEHFMETANRLNSLTENYRSIHEHLADGARTLCGDSIEVKVDRLSGDTGAMEDKLIDIEPPRDYAPKNSPGEPGMLNERFGIDRDEAPPAEHRDTETETVEDDSQEATTAGAGSDADASENNAEDTDTGTKAAQTSADSTDPAADVDADEPEETDTKAAAAAGEATEADAEAPAETAEPETATETGAKSEGSAEETSDDTAADDTTRIGAAR